MNNNNEQVNAYASSHREPALTDYLQIVLRGKWIIVATLVAVTAGTAFFTFTTKPIYEAVATVLVEGRGQQGALPFLDFSGVAGGKNIRNELEILKSRALAEAVANRLVEKEYYDEQSKEPIEIIRVMVDDKPLEQLAPVSQIIDRVKGALSFEPIRDSDVLKINARSTRPREAALLANTVAEIYYERNVQTSRTRSKAVREFLQSQLEAKKSSLTNAEDSLQNYMEKSRIVSLDQEASKVIQQLASLEASRDAVDIDLQSQSKTMNSYKEELTKIEPGVARIIGEANDPYIRMLQEQLAKLEVQKDVTIAQNPSVVGLEIYNQKLKEIDEQIVSLRAKLNERTDEFLRSLLPGQRASAQGGDAASYLSQIKQKIVELQIGQQALQAKKNALIYFIKEYEHDFDRIPQKSIQLARLQRARLSTEKLYLLVEEKFNEAAITEQSEFGYINIIDPAILPRAPISPNIQTNMLLGILLGFGLGIGIVFLREQLNVRLRTPEDLKKRGYQITAAIQQMNLSELRANQNGSSDTWAKIIDPHMVTVMNPLSPVSESFRRIRTGVQYAQLDKPLRSIVVTSANPSEGKTTIAANLAVVFAQADKKVLIVDTDLREPSLHNVFDVTREPGLCDFLFGEADEREILRDLGIGNLTLIPSGKIPPNPAEIVGSQKMKDFLITKSKDFDLVIFDSPPALLVTDAVTLSTLADGVIVVVASGETRADSLDSTMEVLQSVGANTVGIVLNYFNLRKAYGGYYYRYAYKYGYGTRGGDGEREKRTSLKKT